MNEDELDRFEKWLRGFRPEEPPAHLKERILAARSGRSWRGVVLKVAAVIALLASIPANVLIERSSGSGRQAAAARVHAVPSSVVAFCEEVYPVSTAFGRRRFGKTVRLHFQERRAQLDKVTEL